jgi:probable rRNA maturation factor
MGAISNSSVEVSASGQSIPRLSRSQIAAFIQTCLGSLRKRAGVRLRSGDLSVAFVDDRTMRQLNRTFRSRNRTTDVLTFEGSEADGTFGEIIISVDEARRQAREQRHSLPTEIRYLLLHGILHALGYDHENDKGEMNALELAVRLTVGLE